MAFEMKLVVLLVLFGAALGQNNQKIVLYDQYQNQITSLTIQENYIPNLATQNFDKLAYSACLTGIWLLYQNIGYNPNGDAGVEYIYRKNNNCVNLKIVPGQASSIRYVGDSKDYTRDSLTLYELDYFQGDEEYAIDDHPNINSLGNHQSVIITGSNSWTVYDRPSYEGECWCLNGSGNNDPAFFFDLEKLDPVIPRGFIRSLKRGCFCQKTVALESFARVRQTFVQRNFSFKQLWYEF